MGDFFKGLLDKAPDIIHEAAQSPLGLASLSVLVLGVLAFFLFRNAAGIYKLLALGMSALGVLGLVLVFVPASNPAPGDQAATKIADANSLYMAGQYDQAQAAFVEALSLFMRVHDRLGQANALTGLGDSASKLGRNDQARADYDAALALFKEVDDRLGQANVLIALGALAARKNPQQAARYLVEAAQLYIIPTALNPDLCPLSGSD